MTTTSPLAINLLLTNISTGSPANLSNSKIEPGDNSKISLIIFLVRPNSTVTCKGISNNKSKFLVSTPVITSLYQSSKLYRLYIGRTSVHHMRRWFEQVVDQLVVE